MSFVPKPQFPNVPKLPGVPQLVRAVTSVESRILPVVNLGIAGARLAAALSSKPRWGVYKLDEPQIADEAPADDADVAELPEVTVNPPVLLLSPDSIYRMGYLQEWSLPTAPLQDGGFASYNKIASPFEVELRMTKGGTLAERAQFLDDCETVGSSLDLCRIITPERTYQPVNITGISVVREGSQGAYFFAEVDIRFVEVRQVQAQYNNTTKTGATNGAKDPSARPTQNQGVTNAITPPTRVQGLVDKFTAPLRSISRLLGG